MKKIVIVVILIWVLLLPGCIRIQEAIDPTPDEYFRGIDLPEHYPKELKLPEYTIIFESDESKDGITIKCGLNRTMYSIVEFYEELFSEGNFEIEQSQEYDEGYTASGAMDGWEFSLKVKKPTEKYEKRAFMWVMEIELDKSDVNVEQKENIPEVQPDEQGDNYTPEPIVIYSESLNMIEGFWHVCGMLRDTDIYYKSMGIAVIIDENMTITGYKDFEILFENLPFTFVSETAISFEFNGETQVVTFYFDDVYGEDYLVMFGENQIQGEDVFSAYPELYLEKSSYEKMILHKGLKDDYEREVVLDDELSDEELEFLMMECDWIISTYYNPDGTYERADEYEMYRFNTGHVGIYEDADDNTYTFSWAFVDNIIYLYFHNGDERAFLLDYASSGFDTNPELFFFNIDEGRIGRALVFIRFAY